MLFRSLKNVRKYGFDLSLYTSDKEGTPRTYGAYIQNALKLYENSIISAGKYEEYLLDANRDDILFGRNGNNSAYE